MLCNIISAYFAIISTLKVKNIKTLNLTLTDSRASLTTIMARTNSKSSSLMTSFFVVQANTDSREKTMRSDLAVNTGQIEIF